MAASLRLPIVATEELVCRGHCWTPLPPGRRDSPRASSGALGATLAGGLAALAAANRRGGCRGRVVFLRGLFSGGWTRRYSEAAALSSNDEERPEEVQDSELKRLFQKFDKDGNGCVSPSEFLEICREELRLPLDEIEVRRLFANLDTNQSGEISFTKFRHGIRRNCLLRSVALNLDAKVDHLVPVQYDYSVPTYCAHRHPDFVVSTPEGTSSAKTYDPAHHGAVYGEFADIRRAMDYSWHTNYRRERQTWQDQVIRRVAQCTKPQNKPWVIFTAGAMGSGKGYTMSWLSKHNIFPLEHIVHIDPDHFKSLMPEWQGYIDANPEEAGTMCHKESGFLQEIAQEVAMRGSQNVWIDGSLGDHAWYSTVFRQIRRRFEKYRIALIDVTCDPDQLELRVRKRALRTGRHIPERKLRQSIMATAEAVEVLGPLTDFHAKIDNRGSVPHLELCTDRSHSLITLRSQFRLGKVPKPFPRELGDISVHRHSVLSEQMELPEGARAALLGGSETLLQVPLLSTFKPHLRARLEVEMKSRMDLLDGSVSLLLTPAAVVSLDDHSRRRASIPEAARLCVMCHGCAKNGRLVELLALPDLRQGNAALIYLDGEGTVVGVNILSHKDAQHAQFFLQCGKPIALPPTLDWSLELAERWVRHVSPPQAMGIAEAMAWLLPGELPDCPFGGFAYRIYEGPEALSRAPRVVFPVVTSE